MSRCLNNTYGVGPRGRGEESPIRRSRIGLLAGLSVALFLFAGVTLASAERSASVVSSVSAPPTTIPAGAVPPPVDYDKTVLAALEGADADQRGASSPAEIKLPSLPVGVQPSNPEPPPKPIVQPPPAEFAGSEAVSAADCAGDLCYQSDRSLLSDHVNDVYAIDYWYWLGLPQSNESNRCDAVPTDGCFWFFAGQSNTDCCSAAIHIGPQRGHSSCGNAGAAWKMNLCGYNNGVQVGGLGSQSLPAATWVRVRYWRTATGQNGYPPFSPNSTWGVWALWSGSGCPQSDCFQGSVTVDGTLFTGTINWVEDWETAAGPCSTDLERGYFNDPAYLSVSQGWRSFPSSEADYQATCPDPNPQQPGDKSTTWLIAGAPDFIRDERETDRVILDGAKLWP